MEAPQKIKISIVPTLYTSMMMRDKLWEQFNHIVDRSVVMRNNNLMSFQQGLSIGKMFRMFLVRSTIKIGRNDNYIFTNASENLGLE